MISNIISSLFGSITIEVTPEELFNASEELINEANRLKQRIERLKSVINGTSSYWDGDVSIMERSTYQIRYSDALNMIEKINNYASELKTIAQNYSDTELTITESVQELPSNILS